jgi:hypothetical protein
MRTGTKVRWCRSRSVLLCPFRPCSLLHSAATTAVSIRAMHEKLCAAARCAKEPLLNLDGRESIVFICWIGAVACALPDVADCDDVVKHKLTRKEFGNSCSLFVLFDSPTAFYVQEQWSVPAYDVFAASTMSTMHSGTANAFRICCLVIIAFFVVDSMALFVWLHCLLLLGLGCSLASSAS